MEKKPQPKKTTPNSQMSNNKLVNFLPIIALIIGVSTFASIAQAKSPHSYGQIAYGGEGSDEKSLAL